MRDFEEEFPEHARLQPHFEANWDVRNFLRHLSRHGIFLARYNPTRHAIEGVSEVVPENLLLEWRGVDRAAYEAEKQVLDERYGVKKLVARLAPELGEPGSHMPPLATPAPEITKQSETPDPAQDLLNKIRSTRR